MPTTVRQCLLQETPFAKVSIRFFGCTMNRASVLRQETVTSLVWRRKDGKKELITAPLENQLILDGITRRSCLELARQRLSNDLEITERKYTIGELIEAEVEGRLLESFAAGTAVSLFTFPLRLYFTPTNALLVLYLSCLKDPSSRPGYQHSCGTGGRASGDHRQDQELAR